MSVTYFNLALRNAKRQSKDYLVYFVTIVMAAALLYSFNGLIFSQEIRELAGMMNSLPVMIALASIVVVCIFGWLVSYSTTFMLTRRSRELGTYILIGLENRQVARLFFLENLAVGSCALALGIALGGLFYQILRAIALSLFGMPYHFALSLSLPATGLTTACFALIYLYALRRSHKRVCRMNIYDLIYYERLNEGVVIRDGKNRRRMFAVSIVLGMAGTLLLMSGDVLLGVMGAACVIVFLFGFFLSFSSGVPAFFDKRPARKYRGQNLMVFRTLTAKLATMGILMATISMIFTATLISEGTGLVLCGIFEGRAANYACFDLCIGISSRENDHTPYLNYIDEHIPVEAALQYAVYCGDGDQITRYLEADHQTRFIPYYPDDLVLRYSDYAALRAMLGYPEVSLEPGAYLLHCMAYLEPVLREYGQSVTVGGTALTPGGVYTEPLYQYGWDGNGGNFVLVVPDGLAEGQPVSHRVYAAMTEEPVTREQFNALTAIRNDDARPEHDSVHAASDEEAEAAAQTAVAAFPLYYLALALTMTAATILTIQQLSESDRYRRQFELLRKLGMDRRDMLKALRTQFTIYYAMPAAPALLIGVPFIFHLATLPEAGIMVGSNSPAVLTGIALGLFFLIYAIYILLAHISLKRNVIPE